MAAIIDVTIPFKTIVAIRNAGNIDKALDALSEGTGANPAIAESARAIVKAIKNLAYDIKRKQTAEGSDVWPCDKDYTPSKTGSIYSIADQQITITARGCAGWDPWYGDENISICAGESFSKLGDYYSQRIGMPKSKYYFIHHGCDVSPASDQRLAEAGVGNGSVIEVHPASLWRTPVASDIDERKWDAPCRWVQGDQSVCEDSWGSGSGVSRHGSWIPLSCAATRFENPCQGGMRRSSVIIIRDLMMVTRTVTVDFHATCQDLLEQYSSDVGSTASRYFLAFQDGTKIAGDGAKYGNSYLYDIGVADGSVVIAHPNPSYGNTDSNITVTVRDLMNEVEELTITRKSTGGMLAEAYADMRDKSANNFTLMLPDGVVVADGSQGLGTMAMLGVEDGDEIVAYPRETPVKSWGADSGE